MTRRCTQRQFLLRPGPKTNAIFAYCLACAALRTGVLVHAVTVMSNHWHGVVTDPQARLPEFLAYLHRLVAKCVNCELGRWENLWSTERVSTVRLESAEDVVDKIAYTLVNPVHAGLVEAPEQWPGLSARPGDRLTVMRPQSFFREHGPMPAETKLVLTPPATFAQGGLKTARSTVARAVSIAVGKARKRMRRAGRVFVGAQGVLKQRVTDRPKLPEQRRSLRPGIATRDRWRREEAIRRIRRFVSEYREALNAWRMGKREVLFPVGTYGPRVFSGARCAPT